jgi:hypothetical protein
MKRAQLDIHRSRAAVAQNAERTIWITGHGAPSISGHIPATVRFGRRPSRPSTEDQTVSRSRNASQTPPAPTNNNHHYRSQIAALIIELAWART